MQNMAGPSNNPTNAHSAETNPQEKPDAYDIAWIFVQQYYTLFNTKPKSVHLFYAANAKMVHGLEGELVSTTNGQTEISQKYNEFKTEESKIQITNVDVQSSINNVILIQVIGEITYKNESSKRFVQTFVLADQDGRFHIINDIFRYISSKVVPTVASTKVQTATPVTSKAKETVIVKTEPTVVENKEEKKVVNEAVKVDTKVNDTTKASTTPNEPKPSGTKTWATLVSSNTPKVPLGSNSAPTSNPSTGTSTPALKSTNTVSPGEKTSEVVNTISFKITKEGNNMKKLVHEALTVYGSVKSVDIKNGLAVVEFSNVESYNKAITAAKFNLAGESITIEKHTNRPSHSRQNSTQSSQKSNFNRRNNEFNTNTTTNTQNDKTNHRRGPSRGNSKNTTPRNEK